MLNGFQAERRMLRTEIRNFIVDNQMDLEVNYKMSIPQNVKNMPKKEFDAWLVTISRTKVPKILKELLVQYDCASENVEKFSL